MNIDSSFFAYFIHAGLVVKCVLFLLISASVVSWTVIFQRYTILKEAKKNTQQFEEQFWSGMDLAKLYQTSTKQSDANGIYTIFNAGFNEFLHLRENVGFTATAVMENAKRAMIGAQIREADKLELNLPLLASIGSTSPYVGLFGTVWGIMLSFKALASVQQATIAMVAPGIAEALIATAIGLFAAIPAVIAYNRYSTEVNRLLNRFDAFQEEFATILFRQAQSIIHKHETA